jgi:hypothetical protein
MNGDTQMKWARTHPRRRALVLAVAAFATAGTGAAYAVAGSPNQGNRLEATFTSSLQVLNNQIASYGIVQAIATGSGTVETFGAATVTTGVTQDRTVTTCGPGSALSQSASRIATADGTLILRVSGTRCLDPNGTPVDRGTFVVDGAASSGIFEGASGDGDSETVVGATSNTTTFSGKLKLAG